MKHRSTRYILPLSFLLTLPAAEPTFSDEVPFAAPPLPPPGQMTMPAPAAALSDIMGKIQAQHIKLWYAMKFKNWGLINYEIAQLEDSFNNAAVLYQNIPIEYIVAADKPLIPLQDAVKAKDASKLEAGFRDLTAACNSCHRAAEVGFISIKTPTFYPYTDQEILPQGN